MRACATDTHRPTVMATVGMYMSAYVYLFTRAQHSSATCGLSACGFLHARAWRIEFRSSRPQRRQVGRQAACHGYSCTCSSCTLSFATQIDDALCVAIDAAANGIYREKGIAAAKQKCDRSRRCSHAATHISVGHRPPSPPRGVGGQAALFTRSTVPQLPLRLIVPENCVVHRLMWLKRSKVTRSATFSTVKQWPLPELPQPRFMPRALALAPCEIRQPHLP